MPSNQAPTDPKCNYNRALVVHVEGEDENSKGRVWNDFAVSSDLIERRSTYFAKRIAQHQSPVTLRVDLLAITPELFKYYYYQCICANDATLPGTAVPPVEAEGRQEAIDKAMRRYCEAHTLAKALGDCLTANMIIDALIDYSAKALAILSWSNVRKIYKETKEGSGMRSLSVDLYAFTAEFSEDLKDKLEDYPEEFVFDVVVAMKRMVLESAETSVGDAFDAGVVANQRWRYHSHNALHPDPAGRIENDGEDVEIHAWNILLDESNDTDDEESEEESDEEDAGKQTWTVREEDETDVTTDGSDSDDVF